MDPTALSHILDMVAPVLVTAILGSSVVGFFWVGKHYKLREKELELEAQLHARAIEANVRAMEVRLAAVETAIVGRPMASDRAALLEPPPLAAVRER